MSITSEWQAEFAAHVLWMQGNAPTRQPLQDSAGNILLWNGDVFNRQDHVSYNVILYSILCIKNTRNF